MRHQVVTRAAWLHVGLLVLASFAFALAVGRDTAPSGSPPPPPPAGPDHGAGREAFGVRCAGCHDAAELGSVLERWGGGPAAADRMRAFLEGHGFGTAPEQEAIVDWLAAGGG